MANTTVQREAEAWIVDDALPAIYGRRFTKRRLALAWGGAFEFDAVSDDGRIAACISTSQCMTAKGKPGIGKRNKIRADVLYLLHVNVQERVLIFTDPSMLAHFEAAREAGRLPPASQLELRCVTLPSDLSARLCAARDCASAEVSPRLD